MQLWWSYHPLIFIMIVRNYCIYNKYDKYDYNLPLLTCYVKWCHTRWLPSAYPPTQTSWRVSPCVKLLEPIFKQTDSNICDERTLKKWTHSHRCPLSHNVEVIICAQKMQCRHPTGVLSLQVCCILLYYHSLYCDISQIFTINRALNWELIIRNFTDIYHLFIKIYLLYSLPVLIKTYCRWYAFLRKYILMKNVFVICLFHKTPFPDCA